ncbi:hypothetical protein AB0M36_17040 [Actinoplanes sp. NPDC051346]|uniref:hypothetical protein n=1 Tax=Actinoplanes sp. NPDC051346 TaxID=3155048 RepID=UPI0034270E87
MAEISPRQVVAFVRSVAVLGLPADAQVAWLQQLFTDTARSVDELALEFDDGFQLAPAFIELGWLNAAALPALEQLDARLDAMSSDHNAELWQLDGLAREDWDRVRGLARRALSQMG